MRGSTGLLVCLSNSLFPFPQARTADTMKHVLRAHKRQLRGAALRLPWRPLYEELQRIVGGLGMKVEGERGARSLQMCVSVPVGCVVCAAYVG